MSDKTATENLVLETTVDQLRKRNAQIELENTTLRNAQKACEDCDAPTVEKVKQLEAELAQWRTMARESNTMLAEHHQKHQEELVVYFAQDGKPIEISTDLGEAYSDSDMAERTSSVLSRFNELNTGGTPVPPHQVLAIALKRYVQHREGCSMAEDSGYACTCGLYSLLKQLE